jgi:hypothetical protein|tara:strand:- start:313 stop:747 length:435 start_codon:yes stop_codon:yes gene_type:complete
MKKAVISLLLTLYSCSSITIGIKQEETKQIEQKIRICPELQNQKIELDQSIGQRDKYYLILSDDKITYTMPSKIGDISTSFYPLEKRIELHGTSIVRGKWSKWNFNKENHNYQKEVDFFLERIEDELDSTHKSLKDCISNYNKN